MSQLGFFDDFDARESKRRSEVGMSEADRAWRVQVWKQQASWWLDTQVKRGVEFKADDLTAAVGLPDQGVNRNNVLGAWFSTQAKRGLIVWTGRVEKSERVVRRVGLQRIWRKL